MTETEELAYIAGFVDGEGSISCTGFNESNTFLPFIVVGNTNRVALDFLASKFGGNVYLQNENVGHPESKHPKHKRCWTWRIQGKRAGEICEQLLPYLLLKKEQARLVIGLSATLEEAGRHIKEETILYRSILAEKLRELNKRGTNDNQLVS